MSRTTPYNPQPFRNLLRKRQITVAQAAELCGVSYFHMQGCAAGRIRPNDQVRELLPLLTGVSLVDLFTPDRLSRKHQVHPARVR